MEDGIAINYGQSQDLSLSDRFDAFRPYVPDKHEGRQPALSRRSICQFVWPLMADSSRGEFSGQTQTQGRVLSQSDVVERVEFAGV